MPGKFDFSIISILVPGGKIAEIFSSIANSSEKTENDKINKVLISILNFI